MVLGYLCCLVFLCLLLLLLLLLLFCCCSCLGCCCCCCCCCFCCCQLLEILEKHPLWKKLCGQVHKDTPKKALAAIASDRSHLAALWLQFGHSFIQGKTTAYVEGVTGAGKTYLYALLVVLLVELCDIRVLWMGEMNTPQIEGGNELYNPIGEEKMEQRRTRYCRLPSSSSVGECKLDIPFPNRTTKLQEARDGEQNTLPSVCCLLLQLLLCVLFVVFCKLLVRLDVCCCNCCCCCSRSCCCYGCCCFLLAVHGASATVTNSNNDKSNNKNTITAAAKSLG